VDLILEAEQNLSETVNVGVIGRSSEGRPIHSVAVGGKNKEEGGGRLVLIFCIFCILLIFCIYVVALSGSSVVSMHGSGCLFLPVYTSFKHSFRILHQTLTSKSLITKLSHWQIPMATSSRCSMKTTTILKTVLRGRTWGTQAARTHSAVGLT